MSDTNTPLTQNDALEVMGRFLNLANSRGAFNLLEAEQVIRAISVFRVSGTASQPAVDETSSRGGGAPVSSPTVTTI
jgi:hypothetical protein